LTRAGGKVREEEKEGEGKGKNKRDRERERMRARCCLPPACRHLYNTTQLIILTSYMRDALMDFPFAPAFIQRAVILA
jgi:hypothetical protein